MTSNSFAANALEILLGWFKSLVNGVWALFSGTGGSLLTWLSNSWLPLLLFFLILGTALDVVVYLVRWRPFWWWFRKKRLVIDDRALRDPREHRRVPSTKIPPRIRDAQETEKPKADPADDLFMEPSLFDVKAKKETRQTNDLYASARRNHSEAKRPKIS